MLGVNDLHGYQSEGVTFIQDTPKCALWLGLGLGKTVTTLTAAAELLDMIDVHHVLVIAPLRVAKSTWPKEVSIWSHLSNLSVQVACGDAKTRSRAVEARADITTINVENLEWLVKTLGKNWHYDMVVIDESSAFKAHNTKRFKALKRVSHLVHRMVQLTGTPAPNGLIQLWPQIYLLDRGERLMKTMTAFHQTFCKSHRVGPHVKFKVDPAKAPEIYRRLEDIVLTMKAGDYLDMPAQVDIFHDIELSPKQLKAYQTLERDFLLSTDEGDITALNASALHSKLLQFAGGAVYLDDGGFEEFHSAKLDVLATMHDEANGAPLLVAYWFKSDLERLTKRFPRARVLDDNPETIEQWNRGEIDMLLLHPASAGHGLNLQKGGNSIVWFALIFNLELYLQLIGRLLRQGQESSTVQVHHLNICGSVDDDATDAIRKKDATQGALIDAMKRRRKKYASRT